MNKNPEQNADRVQDLRDQRDRETDPTRRAELDRQVRDAEAGTPGAQDTAQQTTQQ